LSRSEIIKKLKEKNPELSNSELNYLIDVFGQIIKESLNEDNQVMLKDFGTFFLKKIKAKVSARDPRNGKLIYVPEKNKVRFRASKKLKEFINK
tara:strand:+ start:2019 stop:2300 length:282 start_codon:yes stop_codon:yes gene_type:complete